jgi:hypothetical protein
MEIPLCMVTAGIIAQQKIYPEAIKREDFVR